jgi:hypothetical protein
MVKELVIPPSGLKKQSSQKGNKVGGALLLSNILVIDARNKRKSSSFKVRMTVKDKVNP